MAKPNFDTCQGTGSSCDDGIGIGRAEVGDAQRVAMLSDPLGYPTTRTDMRCRIETIDARGDHALFVATAGDSDVIGWVYVSSRVLLTN